MASPKPLKDLADRFLQCSICLKNFREPKLLPCLHRFCEECLDQVVESDWKPMLDCPLCKRRCVIPADGARGFKTDFHIKSMCEFVESSLGVIKEPPIARVKVTLAKHPESVINIANFEGKGWKVRDMTTLGGDRVAITGEESDRYSFIAVVNMEGELLLQDKMEKVLGSKWPPNLRCDAISQDKVATLCQSGQIGIYDVSTGSYIKKDINDLTDEWSTDQFASCIAVDTVRKVIYVGSINHLNTGVSRDVLVFDYNLDYQRTLVLPQGARGTHDITIYRGYLLVCDWYGRKVYAVKPRGCNGKLKVDHELPIGRGNWIPVRLCKDREDFIYVLWGAVLSGQRRRIIGQYSQDGRRLLVTRRILWDGGIASVSTITTGKGEKLLIITPDSGKLYQYPLHSH